MRFLELVLLLASSVCAGALVLPSSFQGRRLAVSTQTRSSSSALSMKIFDYAKRHNNYGSDVKDEDLSEHTLRPAPGSAHRKKRKGRGISAGQGASCGFGMRGQRSRSGPGVRAGFEGGQTPLYRRLPKFTGRSMGPGHKRKEFTVIKLEALNTADEGSTVNFETLLSKGSVTKSKLRWHKVLGNGELTVTGLTVQAHAFSTSAKEAIEAKGGKCQLLSPTTNQVVELELA